MRIKLVIFGLLFALTSHAEDVISMKDGNIIKAVVSEITQTEIKYKKASNLSGPVYTIDKADVLSILFENGDIEKFDNAPKKEIQNESSSSVCIKANPSEDNEATKDQYSSVTIRHKKRHQILKNSKKQNAL